MGVDLLRSLTPPVSNNNSTVQYTKACVIFNSFRPRGEESTEVRVSQNKGKESENSYQKMKRSLKDRHTKTHGNCIEIFRQARPPLSIKRENVCEHTTKMALEEVRAR